MTNIVTTQSNGIQIDLDSLPQVFERNGDGNIKTITVTDTNANVFVQTFTYSGTTLVNISAWIQQ